MRGSRPLEERCFASNNLTVMAVLDTAIHANAALSEAGGVAWRVDVDGRVKHTAVRFMLSSSLGKVAAGRAVAGFAVA